MIAGVVLAAGRASRAGGDRGKALARIGGATFLERTAGALRGAGASPVLVVVAAPHAEAIERALPAGCVSVRNDAPERGMLGSLQIGLARAVALGADRVVVSLVDHPRVQTTTVRALIDALDGRPGQEGAILSRPRHAGRRGHPYAIAAPAIEALRAASPERTARDVLLGISPALDVDVDDAGVLDDLDGPLHDAGPASLAARSLRR